MNALFTFDTTHHALWAEEVALEGGFGVQVVPAPKEAAARCDLALEILPDDVDRLAAALQAEGIPFAIFRR